MNFLKQSQAAFFNKYGYIHLQNQLPYHMKFKLLNSINTVEFDSMNKKHLYNHNFELDSSNNKVLSRSEYFAHSKTYINLFLIICLLLSKIYLIVITLFIKKK